MLWCDIFLPHKQQEVLHLFHLFHYSYMGTAIKERTCCSQYEVCIHAAGCTALKNADIQIVFFILLHILFLC